MVTRLMTISILVLGFISRIFIRLSQPFCRRGSRHPQNIHISVFRFLENWLAKSHRFCAHCLETRFAQNLISGVKILDAYVHRKLGFPY